METFREALDANVLNAWNAAKARADHKLRLATDAWIAAERAYNVGDMRGYRYFRRLAMRRDVAAEKSWLAASRIAAAIPV